MYDIATEKQSPPLSLIFPQPLPMLENRAFQRCFRWWRGAGRKREGKRIFQKCCDVATVEYSPPPFLLPFWIFPFSYKTYLPLEWFWGLDVDVFPFLFLFFLGKGWEWWRIIYNLPSEKISFAWTAGVVRHWNLFYTKANTFILRHRKIRPCIRRCGSYFCPPDYPFPRINTGFLGTYCKRITME